MPKTYESPIIDFLGMREDNNPIKVKPNDSLSCYAKILENLRPLGSMLQKIKGCYLHSTIDYKMATRPTTLIRYSKQIGAPLFIATAWDNLLIYAGGAWNPLLKEGSVEYIAWDLIPGNVLYYYNYPFDNIIYLNKLYLTDGYNLPIKTNGILAGTWGYKKFTNANSVLLAVEQLPLAGGNLSATNYYYKVSLHNSNDNHTGNYSDATLTFVPTGANEQVWIYVDMTKWSVTDNYDYENEFADEIRIWRAPGAGAAPATTPHYLAATLKKGLISHGPGGVGERINIVGATGVVTGVGTHFADEGVTAGDALYVLGVGTYQIIVVGSNTSLTIVDSDGTAYTGGDQASKSFRIFAGFLDGDVVADDDITDLAIYHGDDTPAEDHSPPEICKYCCVFNDRAFMAGDPNHPNRVYYSEAGMIDYFPVDYWIDIDPDEGDAITALIKFQGRLYIFKRSSASILNIVGDPFEWSVTPKYLSVGASDVRGIADCDGLLVFTNLAGVWGWDGSSLNHISHNEGKSNIIESWRGVVLSRITDTRVVYHEARNEFWISVTLDDERDLYDSGLAGEGDVYKSKTSLAGVDNGLPIQNNGTFIYRLETGQWFFAPHIRSTAWSVWQGEGDKNELYRGDYHASVYREDITEAVTTQDGYSGQCSGPAGDPAYELQDTGVMGLPGADWTVDEWVGGTIYVHHVADDSTESSLIYSNTVDTITIPASTGGWVTNPSEFDYYILIKKTTGGKIKLRWKTGMLVMGTFKDIKWFIDALIRIYATGTVVINWSFDGGEGNAGQIQLELAQGTTFLGTHKLYSGAGATPPVAERLVLTAWDNILSEINFPINAEGKFVEFEITTETNQKMELTMFVMDYRINRRNKWEP